MKFSFESIYIKVNRLILNDSLKNGKNANTLNPIFAENGAPLLSEEFRIELLKNIRGNFSDLIFRRVARVYTQKKNLIEIRYHTDTDGSTPVYKTFAPKDFNGKQYSKPEFEQNIEFRYRMFYFFTSAKTMRNNDEYGQEEIYCGSNKYSQLDLTDNVSLDFSKQRYMRNNSTPPRVGDLVCMRVEKASPGQKNSQAKFWFTCSDQFLRAWTMLMYDTHETFEAGGEEPRMRQRYMSGNRLNTNSFLKWKLANIHSTPRGNSIPTLDQKELKKRFWHLRTEYLSRRYVHVYSALVLLGCYGEIPCGVNVPVNKPSPAQIKKGIAPPVMNRWNFPEKFVEGILSWTHYSPQIHKKNWFTLNKLAHSSTKNFSKQKVKSNKNKKVETTSSVLLPGKYKIKIVPNHLPQIPEEDESVKRKVQIFSKDESVQPLSWAQVVSAPPKPEVKEEETPKEDESGSMTALLKKVVNESSEKWHDNTVECNWGDMDDED